MSNGNGHHWSKFWWQDYLNDRELKLCSLAAQGLWMRLLCVMHDADGYLLVTGRIPSGRNLATILSVSERQIGRLLDELLQHGVARKTNDGVIYCQRMVNDIKASEAGKEFADKRWGSHKPNGSPSGPPNGQGTGEANNQAYRDPNAKKLEAKKLERVPPVGPHAVGTAPAEPGTPARRGDGTNPRAMGTNPRVIGTNPRARKRGFAEYERRFEAALAAARSSPVIDATADELDQCRDFTAHLRLVAGGSNG